MKVPQLVVLVAGLAVAAVRAQGDARRVDCLPDLGPEQEEAGVCAGRGCTWRPPDQDQAAPPCFYPPGYGYHVVGEAVTTPAGLRVHLQKLGIYNDKHSSPGNFHPLFRVLHDVWRRLCGCHRGL